MGLIPSWGTKILQAAQYSHQKKKKEEEEEEEINTWLLK